MSITTISIGTAGTQSGDKVRDAFSIVNDNFSNFQLSDLKGFHKYFNATGFTNVKNSSWTYSSALISSIPAGTYLIWFGVDFYCPEADGLDQSVIKLVDGSNNDLGIQLFGNNMDYQRLSQAGFVQITKSTAFDIKVGYICPTYADDGPDITNITILLLKVG